MEEEEIIKKDKPPEILEIERAYNLILIEKDENLFDRSIRRGVYSRNSKGNLSKLNLEESNIKDVSPLSNLEHLESLSLGDNTIKDISPIINLGQLEDLNLTRNSIKDISPLASFKKLKKLYLGGNTVEYITPVLSSSNLQVLFIWDNPVKDIEALSQLQKLQELHCASTNIDNLDFLGNLICMERLIARNNKIFNINSLNNLVGLRELELTKNKIQDIEIIENLINLKILGLSNNQIKVVPKRIAEKFWLFSLTEIDINPYNHRYEISLDNNPLEFPPASVIELGSETTKNYYETAEQFGHTPLSEGRIIFVGDGSSGKSSIIEKVLYNTFTLGREQTNGIKIENLHFPHPADNRDLAFHLWDFGGQEIQHAVHKFFFTQGCLYVLVLDNRKEEEPEYWLQQIESLGGGAPVLVVFNKHDENAAETADRKYLKEKYPNIVGFFNTSCKTGFGMADFKKALYDEVVKLRTVDEQFPNNWLTIKKAIEERTSGSQHYLTYETYREICRQNHAESEETQKLLLRYFNTIGAVTWFGEDTYLKFLHVLNPAWITQGVYKILTAKKTANLFGQINIGDFKELLQPLNKEDYTYDENHYGYILSMMKKFDLCYTPDDKLLLIPSAFGKIPKVEYSEFRGEEVRTYILQFKDYMPLALIHRFTAKNLPSALENNYWYTGIVIKDSRSSSLAMVHADKEARRIYVRIKGDAKLGVWEHIRREIAEITSSYAKIPYEELVAVDAKEQNTVNYDDLVSHIKAQKPVYFHPRLQKDFNVGYLMGLFESKEGTLEKVKKGEIALRERTPDKADKIPPFVINILNNNSPTVNTHVNTQVHVDIDIQIVNELGESVKGEAVYLLEALGDSNKVLSDALQKVIQFAEDAKAARNSGEVKGKGWGRKLKNVLETLGKTGEQFKNIQDGGEAFRSMLHKLQHLTSQLNLDPIAGWFS